MKRINWKLGSIISIMLSLVALSFLTIANENMHWNIATLFIVYTFSYCFSCWILFNLLLNKKRESRSIFTFVILTICSIVGIGLLDLAFEWISGSFIRDYLSSPMDGIQGTRKYIGITARAILMNGLYSFITHHIHLAEERQHHIIEISRLQHARLEANLFSLKEQLSPHFLFNTLNTLSTLTEEENVKEYVSELANIYRYLLEMQKNDMVTLKEELAFTHSYSHILKTRMEDAIQINTGVNDELMHTLLPPLTLQLLIENAIKHNIASRSKPLIIDIYNDDDYLIISNNYRPKLSMQRSTGMGLDNVMQRYRLLFNRDIQIIQSDTVFMIKLPIVRK